MPSSTLNYKKRHQNMIIKKHLISFFNLIGLEIIGLSFLLAMYVDNNFSDKLDYFGIVGLIFIFGALIIIITSIIGIVRLF